MHLLICLFTCLGSPMLRHGPQALGGSSALRDCLDVHRGCLALCLVRLRHHVPRSHFVGLGPRVCLCGLAVPSNRGLVDIIIDVAIGFGREPLGWLDINPMVPNQTSDPFQRLLQNGWSHLVGYAFQERACGVFEIGGHGQASPCPGQ